MTEVAVTASPASEKRFAAALEHRFYLRIHMCAMLTATLLAGIFTDRLLARVGLNVLAIRYFLTVAVAYAVFVSSVRLWLMYLGFAAAAAARRASNSSSGGDWFDAFNFSGSGGSSAGSSGASSFSGGGGKFGGGGATGSWGDSDAKPSFLPAFLSSKGSSSSGGKGGSSDDLGELMLVVLIIAVVVAVIAAFVWVIWAAPAILSETAFNAVLAGALAKHAHSATRGSWVGSVVKKTILPFAAILVLATILGAYAQHYCPDAKRLSEAVNCVNPR